MILKKYFYAIKNYKYFKRLEKKKKQVALSFWVYNLLKRSFKMIKNYKEVKRKEKEIKSKLLALSNRYN